MSSDHMVTLITAAMTLVGTCVTAGALVTVAKINVSNKETTRPSGIGHTHQEDSRAQNSKWLLFSASLTLVFSVPGIVIFLSSQKPMTRLEVFLIIFQLIVTVLMAIVVCNETINMLIQRKRRR